MGLQSLLDQQNITKYQLSKTSGVPKTTIIDICTGRSEIQRCSAKTVQLLAKALGCSMEDIMALSSDDSSCECHQDHRQAMIVAGNKSGTVAAGNPKKKYRTGGKYQGKGWMSDDFDAPIDDFREYM